MSVDLPAPFSPMRACTSPGNRRRETSSSAFTPGNWIVMPVIATTGSVGGGTAAGSAGTAVLGAGDTGGLSGGGSTARPGEGAPGTGGGDGSRGGLPRADQYCRSGRASAA